MDKLRRRPTNSLGAPFRWACLPHTHVAVAVLSNAVYVYGSRLTNAAADAPARYAMLLQRSSSVPAPRNLAPPPSLQISNSFEQGPASFVFEAIQGAAASSDWQSTDAARSGGRGLKIDVTRLSTAPGARSVYLQARAGGRAAPLTSTHARMPSCTSRGSAAARWPPMPSDALLEPTRAFGLPAPPAAPTPALPRALRSRGCQAGRHWPSHPFILLQWKGQLHGFTCDGATLGGALW